LVRRARGCQFLVSRRSLVLLVYLSGLVMLARLGLRCAEVAALALDDVDWRQGEIVVRGKGGRSDRLPLLVDVGEAVRPIYATAVPR
jgi:integrase/recombinase XerD